MSLLSKHGLLQGMVQVCTRRKSFFFFFFFLAQLWQKMQITWSLTATLTLVHPPHSQQKMLDSSEANFWSRRLECVVTRLAGTQMDPNFKDSPRDSVINRLVSYTVWHSTFNGFMAVQTQLGCFQNGTHLFFLLFGSGQKAERKWSGLLDSSQRGRACTTHGHLDAPFVSTWEPSALCTPLQRRDGHKDAHAV